MTTSLLAGEWSLLMAPNTSMRYRGEGKILPQTYINEFDGHSSPLYKLTYQADPQAQGQFWSLSLWHTGIFGGGEFGSERVPDNETGGLYQSSLLNVGFTNLFLTYAYPWPQSNIHSLVSISVVRQIFKRKSFQVGDVDLRPLGFDDVNEISAEGVGFGLEGNHGQKIFFHWQAMANAYVQIFDAKTDSFAGHIFQWESGVGIRPRQNWEIEAGWLWHYWFIPSQGDRRISFPETSGAIISWNRQVTRTFGGYLKISIRLGHHP